MGSILLPGTKLEPEKENAKKVTANESHSDENKNWVKKGPKSKNRSLFSLRFTLKFHAKSHSLPVNLHKPKAKKVT
ncbi:MAG: hypothetical protein VKJ64_07030 [Leptolyngbyaceae bacterium]|nr:hypothetical protein [Leptolyngbyaceae bacterium]